MQYGARIQESKDAATKGELTLAAGTENCPVIVLQPAPQTGLWALGESRAWPHGGAVVVIVDVERASWFLSTDIEQKQTPTSSSNQFELLFTFLGVF